VITYHFEGKDEIIDAVLDSAIEEIDRANKIEAEAAAGIEGKIRSAVVATVLGFVEHKEAGAILMSFWSRIPKDARVTKLNAALFQRYRRRAGKLIAEGQKQGVFKSEVSVENIAALMVGAVIGIATQVYFEPKAIDPEAAAELAGAAVLDRLL